MTERIEKEKQFHNHRFEEDTRKHLDKYYIITDNTRRLFNSLMSYCVSNKKVLEYGCGEGSYSFDLAKQGALVYGIDISEVAIKTAKKIADKGNFDQQLEFNVMNAEELDFPDDFFDRICGTAILHHLELKRSLTELTRVLKNDGNALFLEPLGHNPIINLYRKMTKNLRTEDEHPLTLSDLKLFKCFFDKVNIHYFHLTTLLTVPFRNFRIFNRILIIFNKIDAYLFKFTFFRKNAWIIVLELSEPKKNIRY